VLHELPMAMLADELVLLQNGKLLHQGDVKEAQTQRALEAVFDQRIQVCEVQGRWTAIPRL
jgi:iron complex transport system ATP-binding protein